MADIGESAPFTDPAIAISQGKRHLLVRDYGMAVGALAQACQLLAEKHGDTADELGEPYLLYGRALLGLAREEAGVLGGGVPGTGEGDAEEDDEADEDEEDDEEDGEEDGEEEKQPSTNTNAKKENEGEVSKEEKKKEESEKTEKEKKDENEEAKTEDKVKLAKIEEEGSSQDKETATSSATAGSSKESDEPKPSGSSSTVLQNGDHSKEAPGDKEEDVTKEEDEDEEEVNNLQVAWEVLELAKLVLSKREQSGWKLLADAYRLLGEVAMEGGNHQGALTDLQSCLDLLEKIEPQDARAIAEIHYQLALAHSLGNDFDASIEQFKKATELLEARIKELEETKDPPKTDDTFYTVEGEIKELKDLLPEIQEKISDMKDFKQEACRLVIEGIKSKVAGGSCSNGAGPSSSEAGATSSTAKIPKPASDISHLVRKKRKADESDPEIASPCKKPTPEKAV